MTPGVTPTTSSIDASADSGPATSIPMEPAELSVPATSIQVEVTHGLELRVARHSVAVPEVG